MKYTPLFRHHEITIITTPFKTKFQQENVSFIYVSTISSLGLIKSKSEFFSLIQQKIFI